jgi:hypothetical protein
MNDQMEIEVFKRVIDLRQFAVSLGYQVDQRESWTGSTVLRRGADKIVVKRNPNGHYVFFSVRDDRDNGTIIDFLQGREKLSLGAVRQILRSWIGKPDLPGFARLEPTSKDRMRVESEYQRMAEAPQHPYLIHQRCLPEAVLSSPRFAGRVRIDAHGNAVFPHFNGKGLCGYEIKNRGFTSFAAGGEKGLWFSRAYSEDRRLVLAESAIDGLSHAALFPDALDLTRYASLGGTPNSVQAGLVQATSGKLPEGSEIVAAFDADEPGRILVEVVRASVVRTGRSDLVFRVHLPDQQGEDWNDVLKAVARIPPSAASPELPARQRAR